MTPRIPMRRRFLAQAGSATRVALAGCGGTSDGEETTTDEMDGGLDETPTEGGDPVEGDVTAAIDLWGAGTEPNAEPTGEGPDQGDDDDGIARRLSEVDDGHESLAVSDTIRMTLSPAEMMHEEA